MQIVIDIPESTYKYLAKLVNAGKEPLEYFERVIMRGIPLPKGHGDLIDRKLALSDDGLCEFHMYDDYVKMWNYLKSIPPIIGADNEGKI